MCPGKTPAQARAELCLTVRGKEEGVGGEGKNCRRKRGGGQAATVGLTPTPTLGSGTVRAAAAACSSLCFIHKYKKRGLPPGKKTFLYLSVAGWPKLPATVRKRNRKLTR